MLTVNASVFIVFKKREREKHGNLFMPKWCFSIDICNIMKILEMKLNI